MNNNVILSKNNDKVKEVSKLLSSKKYRNKKGLYVVEGLRLCTDALGADLNFSEVFYTEDFFVEHKLELELILNKCDSHYMVSDEVLTKISDTVTPQGIVATVKLRKYTLSDVEDGFYIGLEDPSNPSNVGAIARSAEAFGAKGIIIASNGCDPFSPKSLRSSMGSFFRLPIIIVDDFCEAISKLKSTKSIYASVVDSSADMINSIEKAENSVLLIGNEANGLSEDIVELSDYRVTIPMSGRNESLNAATAAAIFIWEFLGRGI